MPRMRWRPGLRTGHSSYSITTDRGAPEVADSGGPPAMDRWAGGASPPLRERERSLKRMPMHE